MSEWQWPDWWLAWPPGRDRFYRRLPPAQRVEAWRLVGSAERERERKRRVKWGLAPNDPQWKRAITFSFGPTTPTDDGEDEEKEGGRRR